MYLTQKHSSAPSPAHPHPSRAARSAFTLIELIVVISIIVILSAIAVPAIKNLTKSNDTSQAANLVRTMIAQARTIAVSQHRMAGVVFFEETATYSRPVNTDETAMQLFVEAYNQSSYAPVASGLTVFVSYSAERQYLPAGIKLATLSDNIDIINTSENSSVSNTTRAIVFDSNGQIINYAGLATPDPAVGSTNPGEYPKAYGDWNFLKPNGANAAGNTPNPKPSSSPAFFLYNKSEFDEQAAAFAASPGPDKARADWLKQHADVIVVNAYTGTVIR
jgi:prepilin-type N-terminal cleavage/methylation domain-containing protein